MGLYDNAYFSVYEEIKRFYPVWYWDVLEMDAIWRAQGKQLDQVREAVQRLISNNFIATSDDQAVTALEEVFGVVTDTDTQASGTARNKRATSVPLPAPDGPEMTKRFP